MKRNVTLFPFINKEVRCAWCIYRINYMRIDAVDALTI